MVDEIYLGYAIAAITVAAPIILYLLLSSSSATALGLAPSQPIPDQGHNGLEIMPVVQSLNSELNNIDYDHNNPEQVLRIAYEQRAQSEVDRCLGQGNFKDLCDDTMGLLINSCEDSIMHVAACDDPRLAQYKTHLLNN